MHVEQTTPMSDRIVVSPEVMLGKPVIRGTRLTVELLLRAAIAYAADTVARERHSKIG